MGLILLCVILGLQIWQWRCLRTRVDHEGLSRLKALLLYLAWSMAPPLAVALALLGAIGLEEGPGLDVISEPMARTSPFLVGLLLLLSLLGSVAFAVACLMGALRERRVRRRA